MSATPEAASIGRSAERVLYGARERLALIAGGLIMLGIVVVSVLIAQRTDAYLSLAVRAQAVRALTAEVLQAVVSAETGQRGYLLTHRPAYRAPYDGAVARLPSLLDHLEQFDAGDQRLKPWRAMIQAKMAELHETVQLEETGRHADALATVLTDRGRNAMTAIRAIAAGLSATQNQMAGTQLHRSQQGTRLLVVVEIVALIQLLALSGFVSRSIRSTVRALRQSGTALRRANTALEGGRDRLEIAVAERTAELTDANEEIQRFAYIVSHDLRAPLLNIIGFTSELENATLRLNRFVSENLEPAGIVVPPDVREASRDDLPEAIRFIQTSAAKMDRLITAILRLSREGRRVLVPEHLDMGVLLRGIFDSVRHQADSAGATLTLAAVPPVVSDRLALEQVFSNLVENALKYLAPGRPGEITVGGGYHDGMPRYEVRDNGRGVAERDRERIFELFRRAGPQDTTGEGIGLAHVRTLLRRLGGTIECQSVHGAGSVFVVQLPATLAAGNAAQNRNEA